MGQEEVRGEPELWLSSSQGGHKEQAEEVLFPGVGAPCGLQPGDDAGKVPLVGARRLRWSEKASASQSVTGVERGWM